MKSGVILMALIQYNRCPNRKEEFGHRQHTGRKPREGEGRDHGMLLQAKECQRLPASHQKHKRHGTNSHTSWKKPILLTP